MNLRAHGGALALGLVLLVGPGVVSATPGDIVSPTAGSIISPDATFTADAPPGTAKLVFFVDGTRIASFDGPGRHTIQRHLAKSGARVLIARSLDGNGSVIDQRTVSFVVAGLVLEPAAQSVIDGKNARLAVTPEGLPLLAHVTFTADGFPLGEALGAPWEVHHTFSTGGARKIEAKGYDAGGKLLAAASETIVVNVASSDLVPPSARGAIRSYAGKNGSVKLNDRTVAMLDNARTWLVQNGGVSPARAGIANVVQGSYHPGVGASAGTHDGGGVLDLSIAGLSTSERAALVRALREAGFAAWVRVPPAFAYHIHAVAIGDPDLSPAAALQVHYYFKGRDGLAHEGPDPHGGPIVKAWMAKFH